MGKLQIACARLGMLETNCYFGYDAQTGGTFIVDPADDAEAIKGWCLANGKRPAAILLTHGHFDHILAADALRREFSMKFTRRRRKSRFWKTHSITCPPCGTGRSL